MTLLPRFIVRYLSVLTPHLGCKLWESEQDSCFFAVSMVLSAKCVSIHDCLLIGYSPSRTKRTRWHATWSEVNAIGWPVNRTYRGHFVQLLPSTRPSRWEAVILPWKASEQKCLLFPVGPEFWRDLWKFLASCPSPRSSLLNTLRLQNVPSSPLSSLAFRSAAPPPQLNCRPRPSATPGPTWRETHPC